MAYEDDRLERRRRKTRARVAHRLVLTVLGVCFVAFLSLGFAFAGSRTSLAEGVRIAGVDVGGLDASEATRRLEQRSRALARVPVVFRAGSERFAIEPRQLGVQVDWRSAVATARREGEGFGPIRGLRRLGVRFFGSEVVPSTRAWDAALEYRLGTLATAIDRPARDAALRLHGLRPEVVASRPGRVLDRAAAADVIVRALASLDRRHAVWLPLRLQRPRVTTVALRPAAIRARTVLSAPVTLTLGATRYRVPRRRLAQLLELPAGGQRALQLGGAGAERYFATLSRTVDRPPVDASFAVYASGVRVVPSKQGLGLDVPRTARALLAAATRSTNRVAAIAVATTEAERTTAEARAMGISGVVGSYSTTYGGDSNRIHNVQLVAHLVDNHLIAPAATFSFNDTTGDRNAEKGFLEAPVIINGELQTGLGGGVCQVSTTVFNAAYEAGMPITARANHALYISHYPQGRDATVNYPDVDLRFQNDTGHWLLLRTFVGSSSLTVNLYGTPTGRRVESETAPLQVVGTAPMERQSDPTLEKGKTEVVSYGVPPRSTSVHRRVYDAKGDLIREDSFYSSYRGEAGLVRVGTKPTAKRAKPKAGAGADAGLPGRGGAPAALEPVTPPL